MVLIKYVAANFYLYKNFKYLKLRPKEFFESIFELMQIFLFMFTLLLRKYCRLFLLFFFSLI